MKIDEESENEFEEEGKRDLNNESITMFLAIDGNPSSV